MVSVGVLIWLGGRTNAYASGLERSMPAMTRTIAGWIASRDIASFRTRR